MSIAEAARPRVIYGGGYMTGSAALDVYDPEQYVERGIVYVAMQYRYPISKAKA